MLEEEGHPTAMDLLFCPTPGLLGVYLGAALWDPARIFRNGVSTKYRPSR